MQKKKMQTWVQCYSEFMITTCTCNTMGQCTNYIYTVHACKTFSRKLLQKVVR